MAAAGGQLCAPGLAYIHSIYGEAGSGYAKRSHARQQAAANEIRIELRRLMDEPAPTGYLESSRRVQAAFKVANLADDFCTLTAGLLGDTSQELHLATEAAELLTQFANTCEADDQNLRNAIHTALRKD